MTSRHRERAKTSPYSVLSRPSGATSSFTFTEYDEKCDDVIGDRGGEHPLTIERVTRYADRMGGNSKTSLADSTYCEYTNYVQTFAATHAANHLSLTGVPSNNEVAIKTLYRTNPSRPEFDLPLALLELKDVPSMIRGVGNLFLNLGKNYAPIKWITDATAGSYLTFEYGLKPLMSDVQKLCQFQSAFDLQAKKLAALYGRGGYHGKMKCGTYSNVADSTPIVTSIGGNNIFADKVTTMTVQDVWGTTRWTPDPTHIPPRTPKELMDLARLTALGINDLASLQTLWNVMPWSWMIDWFSNASEYFGTFRNRVGAIHSPVCVMKHTKTTVTGKVSPQVKEPFSTGGKSFTIIRETKSRVVMPFVLPELHIQFMDERQASIMGSIAVTQIPEHILQDVF